MKTLPRIDEVFDLPVIGKFTVTEVDERREIVTLKNDERTIITPIDFLYREYDMNGVKFVGWDEWKMTVNGVKSSYSVARFETTA